MFYVVLAGNTVVETHTAPDDLAALPPGGLAVSAADYQMIAPGATRNPDGTFSAAPAQTTTVVTRLAFAQLFTTSERMAIRSRQAQGDAIALAIADFWSLLDLAPDVTLSHPAVTQGLAYLVAQGLLTASRKAAILAGTPPA